MFTRPAPQKTQHDAGFIVQVADRFSIEYIEGDMDVSVEIEFGPVSTAYGDTLKARTTALPALFRNVKL